MSTSTQPQQSPVLLIVLVALFLLLAVPGVLIMGGIGAYFVLRSPAPVTAQPPAPPMQPEQLAPPAPPVPPPVAVPDGPK